MPYIKQEDRDLVDKSFPATAGELNYTITKLCKEYMFNQGEKYQHYNDVIGALEGCKLELYRRKVAPYENTKIEENGDVY